MANLLFSDQEHKEVRPVIILSKNNYNENYDDVIVCGVTTNSAHPLHLPILVSDLERGTLKSESGTRSDLIARIQKNELQFKIGKITEDYHKRLVGKIVELIG